MTNSRVARGRKTQELAAKWFREHGWAGAESRPASLPGTDIYGMPGWAPEVKATRGLEDGKAIRQAVKNAPDGDIPFVVFRPAGYGEERIDEWRVVLTLNDFTWMMSAIEQWGD